MDGEDTYLRLFYLALPTMPLFYQADMVWQDRLPSHIINTGWRRFCVAWINPVFPHWVATTARYTFESYNVVTGSIANPLLKHPIQTKIVLNPFNKIDLIQVGGCTLQRANLNKTPVLET